MTTEVSVATDLGALLRDSIDTGLASAHSSGHMPVQIGPLPASGVQAIAPAPIARIPTPGEFSVIPAPSSTARPVVMDAASTAPAPTKKKGGVAGLVLGAIALASALGGGAAFYMQKHRAAPVVVASAPVAAVDVVPAPVAKESAPAPIPHAEEEVAVAPVVDRTSATAAPAPVADEPKAEEPKVDVKPKRAHRTATAPAKVEAAPVVAKAEAPRPVVKAEAPKPAPKPEPVAKVEAPKPAPKPAAGGAVDAVLQQQLSGAIP